MMGLASTGIVTRRIAADRATPLSVRARPIRAIDTSRRVTWDDDDWTPEVDVSATQVDRPTREALQALGGSARQTLPPATLGAWAPAADRPDPIALLEEQAATRLPQLVPVRYGRMAVSPFTFYRGAALPMAADLSSGPRSTIEVQLCGDAHLVNFGLFASPERDLLFDINDFDETLRGPFEFDLKRLSASLIVAGRSLGFASHDTRHIVHRAVRSYRDRMAGYATMRAIDVYYDHVAVTGILALADVDKHSRAMIEGTVRSTAHHDAVHELPKLTAIVDGQRRIVEHPPTLVRLKDVTPPLAGSILEQYRATLQEDRRELLDRYHLTDYALKVVGVGSVGLGAFVALFLGAGGDVDPLILQVKEAQASVYERYLQQSTAATHGERVVNGQRRLQAASDILLGWGVGENGHHWYVRQHQDQKGSAVIETMTLEELATWGELCGWALARGHARSGEPATIAGYLGTDDTFEHAMSAFGSAYADQTEKDHAALTAAIASGRVTAESGV
jgi:uncharacterized protein (DUF2252 family)